MENKKEMTTPIIPAATDMEQSIQKCTDNSIVNQNEDFKAYEQSFEEMQREILRQLDPSYLKTVSMTKLYDTVFEVQTPLIVGLLERGTYLFVGSPKVGKSFMMAQLAYHISTGSRNFFYRLCNDEKWRGNSGRNRRGSTNNFCGSREKERMC